MKTSFIFFYIFTNLTEQCLYKMDSENLALVQEEATLTKIRNHLNNKKIKLWEAPYYDTEKKVPCEVRILYA